MSEIPESFESTLPFSANKSNSAKSWVNVIHLHHDSVDIKLPLDLPVETSHSAEPWVSTQSLHTPGGQRVSSKEHGRTGEPVCSLGEI